MSSRKKLQNISKKILNHYIKENFIHPIKKKLKQKDYVKI